MLEQLLSMLCLLGYHLVQWISNVTILRNSSFCQRLQNTHSRRWHSHSTRISAHRAKFSSIWSRMEQSSVNRVNDQSIKYLFLQFCDYDNLFVGRCVISQQLWHPSGTRFVHPMNGLNFEQDIFCSVKMYFFNFWD